MDARGADTFGLRGENRSAILRERNCRDKDASIAALYINGIGRRAEAAGKDAARRPRQLYTTFGYFLEGQRSHASQGPRGKEQIDSLMRAFRTRPPQDSTKCGWNGCAITASRRSGAFRGANVGALETTKGDLLFLDSADAATQFSICGAAFRNRAQDQVLFLRPDEPFPKCIARRGQGANSRADERPAAGIDDLGPRSAGRRVVATWGELPACPAREFLDLNGQAGTRPTKLRLSRSTRANLASPIAAVLASGGSALAGSIASAWVSLRNVVRPTR